MKPHQPPVPTWGRQLALDLRCAGRACVDRPLGAALIVVTLALLTGTATAFFALYHGARHRSHDVAEIHRALVARMPPLVADAIRPKLRSVVSLGFVLPGARRVAGEQLSWAAVSPGWLEAVRPTFALGGGFSEGDFARPAGKKAHRPQEETWADSGKVIISHRLWRERFASAPDVIGRTLAGSAKVIVGVFAPGFVYPAFQHQPTDLWVPFRDGDRSFSGTDADFWLQVALRLAPGATTAAAEEEVRRLAAQSLLDHPEIPPQAIDIFPLAVAGFRSEVETLRRILVAALILVLVGCANVGTQVLGRGLRRRREQVLHVVLGAWPGRLAWQGLLAGLVLASAGALLGVPVARFWLALLKRHYVAAAANPGFFAAGFNGPSLLFLAALIAAVALLIALPGAIHLARTQLHVALKASTATHSGSRTTRRLREALLALQVGLTALLFISAGTTASAIWRMMAGKGFDARDLVYLRVAFDGQHWRDDQAAFRTRVLAGLRGLADVEAAGLAWPEPFARGVEGWELVDFALDGHTPGSGTSQRAANRIVVGGDFFPALGIPLVRGRLFDPSPAAPTRAEVLVDQFFVDAILGGLDPVGRRIHIGEDRWPFTVAGVVGTAHFSPSPGVRAYGIIYLPHRESTQDAAVTFVIRTARDPAEVGAQMKGVVHQVDPRRRVVATGPYRDLLADVLLGNLGETLLNSAFVLIALLLAALGLHSVATALVVSRVTEFAVRIAIGAPRGSLLLLLLRQGLRPVTAGLLFAALGLGAGLQVPALRHHLLQGNPLEWPWVAAAAALVTLTGLLALLPPAWQASRLSPHAALKAE